MGILTETDVGWLSATKARLVAQGFTQRFGIDYYSTFSPVAHADNVRLLFALAATHSLLITQVDIETAFLYGSLEESIYMRQPEGFSDGTDRVWKLRKSLYGLKQAPKCWNEKFSGVLISLGFKQTIDRCIFYNQSKHVIIAIYVDDALVLSKNQAEAVDLIEQLRQEFEIHIIVSSKFLGLQYSLRDNGDVILHQERYTNKLLETYGMLEAKSAPTPFMPNPQLTPSEPFEDNKLFREVVGALLYLSSQSRPDIAFSVGYLGRKLNNPTTIDWQIVKRLLRYLVGTRDLGIVYSNKGSRRLEAYSDADFAGDLPSRKSTSCQIIFYGNGPVAWRSKLQATVATSTTEAEYLALSAAIKTVLCLKDVCQDLMFGESGAVPINSDNRGAVLIAKDDASTQRTRHLGAQLNFARECHRTGKVEVRYVPASLQRADMLTKPLTPEKFRANRALVLFQLMMVCMVCCCGTVSSSTTMGVTRDAMHKPVESEWSSDSGYPYVVMNTGEHTKRMMRNQSLLDGPEEANLVTLVETRHYTSKGMINDIIRLPKRAHCQKWSKELNQHSNDSVRYFIIKRLKQNCEALYKEEYIQMTRMMSDPNNRYFKPRKPRQTDESLYQAPIPFDCSDPRTPINTWLYVLAQVSIVGFDIAQYADSTSGYHTAFQNRLCLQQLMNATNSLRQQVGNIQEINRLNIQNLNVTLYGLNKTNLRVDEIVSTMPEVMHQTSVITNEMMREIDLLSDLRNSFALGRVDIDALTRLTNYHYLPFHDVSPEETKFLRYFETDDEMFIYFSRPRKDNEVSIYQIVAFRDIIVKDNVYKTYSGPMLLMQNHTCNCSRLIDQIGSWNVDQKCTKTNESVNYYDSQLWSAHELSDNIEWRDLPPLVEEVDMFWMIQCYEHSLVINDTQVECGTLPILLPIEQEFTLDTRQYLNVRNHYDHTYRNSSKLFFTPAILNDTWRTSFEAAVENLRIQQKLLEKNEDIERSLQSFAYDSWRKYPVEFGAGTIFILIFVSIIGISCWHMNRTDPLVQIMKMQMMANLCDGKQSKSCPELNRSWEAPSINIVQLKQVNFKDHESHLYPSLDAHLESQNWRPPTPFHPPSAPRLPSQDSLVKRPLELGLTKPQRFLTTPLALSTISLPSNFV